MKKTCTDCFTDYEAKSLFDNTKCPKCGSTNSIGGGLWGDIQSDKSTNQTFETNSKKWWQFWK
jgi:PHP family Zn ribbon phosphoesterase